MAKWMSLIVKAGALLVIIFVPLKYAIDMQLLGGILIIQTLPAVIFGLYTRWFNSWALLIGWAVGTAIGSIVFVQADFKTKWQLVLAGYGMTGYNAMYTPNLYKAVAMLMPL